MGRVTSPPGENPNNGVVVPQTGIPIQQTGVSASPFAPPNYHQANVNLSVGSPWGSGLFDCQEDQTNAVMTAILPCVTFGQIAEVMDEGEMTCPLGGFIYLLMMPALCSQWVMGSKYREKIRRRFNLVEAPYSDCFTHVLCSCCSLCQEYRELKARNLNPSLGWNGILAQRQGNYESETPTFAPPSQYMAKHLNKFTSLHLFLINAIVVANVFTAIEVSISDTKDSKNLHKDAKKIKDTSKLPVDRLFVFGVLLMFMVYITLKGWNIVVGDIWFYFKRVLDCTSLSVGAASFGLLISCTILVFTKSMILPILCVTLGVSIIFGISENVILEWIYVILLRILKDV